MNVRSLRAARVACAMTLTAAVARAQSAPDEAHVQRGVELRRAGRDEAALDEFRAAWESSHTPRARAQMALACQALGRWVEAESFLTEALARADDPWVARNRATLETSLRGIGAHLGSLDLRVNVEGAAVRVDGHDVGRAPFTAPLRLPLGTVRIELRAEGYLSAERSVALRADAPSREEFTLARAEAQPPPAATTPAAPPSTPAAPASEALTLTLTPPHPRGSGRRLAAWMTAGGALAMAGAGTVFFFLRNTVIDDFNAQQPSARCSERDTRSLCADPVRAANLWEALALGGWIAGGALAVTSAVLFATSPRGESSTRASLWSHCAVGPAGAACQWRF